MAPRSHHLRSSRRRKAGNVELGAHLAHGGNPNCTRNIQTSNDFGVGNRFGTVGKARMSVSIDQAGIREPADGLRRPIGRAVANDAVDDPRLGRIRAAQRPGQMIRGHLRNLARSSKFGSSPGCPAPRCDAPAPKDEPEDAPLAF